VDEHDQIVRCNLIVSTTHNNQAMNEAIRQVARQYIDGKKAYEGLPQPTSKSPSALSTPACPAPPMRWARCRWKWSCLMRMALVSMC